MAKNRDDPVMDSVLRRALRGSPRQPVSACPDENSFAAYLDNRLERSQRAAFEDHTSDCRKCREILALSLRMEISEPANRPRTADVHDNRSLGFKFSLPLSSLALLVVAALALWAIYQTYPDRPASSEKMAELKVPVSPPPPAADSLQEQPAAVAPPEAEARLSGRDGPASGLAESPRISSAATEDQRAPTAETESGSMLKDKDSLLKAKEETTVLRAQVQKPSANEPGKADAAIGKTGTVSQAQGGRDANELEVKTQLGRKTLAAAPAVRPDSFRPNEIQDLLLNFSQAAGSYREVGAGGRLESRDEAKSAARQPAARVGESTRTVGSKTFIAFSGYWIDSECARYPEEAPVELLDTTETYSRIRKALPTMEQILGSDQPIILRWDGTTYLVR